MSTIEIIRGVERRRRWRVAEKLSIVAEADRPGATVSAVARRHDLHPNQLFKWRCDVRLGRLRAPSPCVDLTRPMAMVGAAGFAPVAVADDGGAGTGVVSGGGDGVVEVMLTNGRVVRVGETIEPLRLARLVSVLDG